MTIALILGCAVSIGAAVLVTTAHDKRPQPIKIPVEDQHRRRPKR